MTLWRSPVGVYLGQTWCEQCGLVQPLTLGPEGLWFACCIRCGGPYGRYFNH